MEPIEEENYYRGVALDDNPKRMVKISGKLGAKEKLEQMMYFERNEDILPCSFSNMPRIHS